MCVFLAMCNLLYDNFRIHKINRLLVSLFLIEFDFLMISLVAMVTDIVVGAPYEDEMQGAVYVYNGCKTGVWPVPSQRITGTSMMAGTLGFGVSFSKPQDMNEDGVNGQLEKNITFICSL